MRQHFDKVAPLREALDLNDFIREMVVLSRDEAARHAVSIRAELTEDLSRVIGDREQLKQVLMNQIVNGIEAMGEGEGIRELAIKSERSEDGQITVSVSDTGIGLPPVSVNQIFNAFFRTKPYSIGLGLSISRSIIEKHGGQLWAANNSSRGANFSLTLPVEAEQSF
jgi:signal transduction histidine kinase